MLKVRPGTSLDEAAALALWQADLARREQRSGGPLAQRFRQRLRSPQALLMVAEQEGRLEGMLLAELGRADTEGFPRGDGDGPLVPGLLHIRVLVARPGSTAARALLRSVTGRFAWVTVWAEEPAPYELCGFVRTGLEAAGAVHLDRRVDPSSGDSDADALP